MSEDRSRMDRNRACSTSSAARPAAVEGLGAAGRIIADTHNWLGKEAYARRWAEARRRFTARS
jgi:hypothetical protein